MSTIKVTNVQNPSAASAAITLDTNGQATLNGLAYPTSGSLSGRNRVINGDMRIDQRNAGASVGSASGTSAFSVDRWLFAYSQTSKMTAQQNAGSVSPPAGFTNYLGITSSSAYPVLTSDTFNLFHRIEGFNVADLGWGSANAQTITVSFWVMSSLTGTFGAAVQNRTADRSYPFSYEVSSANTWEKKTITIAGDTTGTWETGNLVGLQLIFGLGNGATYSGTGGAWTAGNIRSVTGATSVVGTNGATFYVTGVQLEAGSVATPFERRSYGQELSLCQRYYEKGDYAFTLPLSNASVVASYAQWANFMVWKRAIPTITGTNDQGTFTASSMTGNGTLVGRSNTVANRNNTGTFIADAEF